MTIVDLPVGTLLTRNELRKQCEALGFNYGRAGQWVRRIVVSVIPGQELCDRELTFAQGDDILLGLTPAPALTELRESLYAIARDCAAVLSGSSAIDIHFALPHDIDTFKNSHDAICIEDITPCTITQPASSGTTVTARIQSRSGGRITNISCPPSAHVVCVVGDHVEIGTPLVHFHVHAETPSGALHELATQLSVVTIAGVNTDQRRIAALITHPAIETGTATTALVAMPMPPADMHIIVPGIQTTVQDCPGRIGYWAVGVPPSGPMDDVALQLVNQVVGNATNVAGLEITLGGVTIQFGSATTIALGGASAQAHLDGQVINWWKPIAVSAGSILKIGGVTGHGVRTYLSVRGGINAPLYLGSRSTFTLGGFGGYTGRELRAGDELTIGDEGACTAPMALAKNKQPKYEKKWRIGVLYGPHGEPEFFTTEGLEQFFSTSWKVSPQSNRTGIRLIGPKPQWARSDGGEAGLHPSNIHDNAYALGSLDFTGDMPVILGPDGPSLGGFVCPVVVATAERWKLGQLKAGDTIQFIRLDRTTARTQAAQLGASLMSTPSVQEPAILHQIDNTADKPAVCYRRAGDDNILIEYGPLVLDLGLRMRVHALQTIIESWQEPEILDITAGIRSLQVHFNPSCLDEAALLQRLISAEQQVPDTNNLVVPSRIVHLPLSWNDPATQKAIAIYMRTVNPDAPWCPSNLEFISRINGLASIDDVYRIVFEAEYLVMGLGDVYLGAPVATPVDPRHRLVTTKYNPARTWTPENAVGIGGAYMCVYGMEGPGGYQFVGRTVQMWNSWKSTKEFTTGKPWLLQPFDRIRFYPVSAEELLQLREDFPRGKCHLRIEDGSFSLAAYTAFLAEHAESIQAFTKQRQQAFTAERQRWEAAAAAQQPDKTGLPS